jgi:DNA polymerase
MMPRTKESPTEKRVGRAETPSARAAFQRIIESPSYGELKERLAESDCRRCALWEGRTRIVVDRGNPSAKILVVGEAPGETEDREGRAFVGRAGKSFDRTMAEIGLDTERDMLIANIAKCRPPNNRAPKREEAETCHPYLKRQIDLVKPRVIVLLGATALRHLNPALKAFSMKDRAGSFFEMKEHPGVEFVVFYHPAAVFYNSKVGAAMKDHARALKKFLDEGGTK